MAVGACASLPEDPIEREVALEANDPLEPMNRAVFAFNMEVDRVILEPTARAYRKVVPQPGRIAIHHFLQNLKMPVTFVNDLLQFEFARAADTLARFVVNSTVGIGGVLDIAGIPEHEEDFGQTFARWGAGEGFYLVLPLFGPSNPRDALGLVAGGVLDPWQTVLDPTQTRAFAAERTVTGAISDREAVIEEFDEVRRTTVDLYATVRSVYRQTRGNEIRNGAPPPDPVFEFD